jgi:four helix bundle protein
LEVWQRGMALAKSVYETTQSFPKHELYSLSGQMRRSALSVPSNIAEGAARETPAELLRFLHFARGSLAELETQAMLAEEIGYLNDDGTLLRQLNDVYGLLNGLINRVRSSLNDLSSARYDRVRENVESCLETNNDVLNLVGSSDDS